MSVDFPLDKIKNIGFIAHIDAGKTTTTERVLFYTGIVHRIGEVHDGSATMDWMEQEKERGITITSAATSCYWKGHRINIIDTPGHVDFTVEVERSLRILDGAIGIFDAVEGVEAQSETVWHQADKYDIPRIAFINKMDRLGADFYYSVSMIQEKLSPTAFPIQLPLGEEENFYGIIDLVSNKAFKYKKASLGLDYEEIGIPYDMREKVEKYKQLLLEQISEFDDYLLEKYLKNEKIPEQELKRVIRQATIAGKFHPILCGSALRNIAIQFLIDAIVYYLPSPLEVPPIIAHIPNSSETRKIIADEKAPFSALAFKIFTDPNVGKLTYFRVYSGTLKKGEYVLNVNANKKERINRIVRMHANKMTNYSEVCVGNIAACIGLKYTTTGDSLTALDAPVLLENITFPEPVISIAIEPKTKADEDRLEEALSHLSDEDPTFHIKEDKETGQIILSGMGELHLEILIDRMRRDFRVDANVGQPRVSYKETITKESEARGQFIRQTGLRGQYGDVTIKISPIAEQSLLKREKIIFVNNTSEEQIPKEFISAIESGIHESAEYGVLTGNKVEGVKVTVIDGSFHPVDSSELAFKLAASIAFNNALKKANPTLLEPIMRVVITTPTQYFGSIVSNINARRGKVLDIQEKKEIKIIESRIPLAELFGYSTSLRSLSQGRASYTMEFAFYDKLPNSISKEIIEKIRGY
ncbi:MAG: elongation factor G [Candidatus Cloacimonadota bacterium]|nr:MAG: elongation factor G [Candidatus Cloacimonadota bacterium]